MAHAPLVRANTSPVLHTTASTRNGIGRVPSAFNMSTTARISQLSGSTTFPSTVSLSSMLSLSQSNTLVPGPAVNAAALANGQVVATSNIINEKADASRSLYQICVSLKQRLAQVPGFEPYMQQLESFSLHDPDGGPVESLWKLLRKGYPLLAIYNALDPDNPLQPEEQPTDSDAKRSQRCVYKFVQACLHQLKIPTSECFMLNELQGNDTTGFCKVTAVINYILNLLEQEGRLLKAQQHDEVNTTQPDSKMSYRDYVVRELVDTERKYVQDLENLFDLKKMLEQKGVIPGDTVHQIFLNINAILDFQRRFLIRVETTNSQPVEKQDWGAPFAMHEDGFSIYFPFIANQRKAAQLANQAFDKIQTVDHPVAVDSNTLDGFLLKPMQRLVKYPLLLKDLLKKSEDEAGRADLTAGINATERILGKANDAVNSDLLDEAVQDLIGRVDDWKNHRLDQFGDLLMHGVYGVVTGKADQEKDYEIYLFESILLCCKELGAPKSKDKKDRSKSTQPRQRNKYAKLQLKGRIFMSNVTDIVAISKTGSYTVQIYWKGDPGVESFIIKFQNEDMMKRWAATLDDQRKRSAPTALASPDAPLLNFPWMQTQGVPTENPYAQDEEEEDESAYMTPAPSLFAAAHAVMPGTMPRNASNTSLRQRSMNNINGSQPLAGAARIPPPQLPMPHMPPVQLSLQTSASPAARMISTGGPPPDSYFSPVAESPASSRTSTTSGIWPPSSAYPYAKPGIPQGWVSGEDISARYTAPAMPRAPSRDGPSPVNPYGMTPMSASGSGQRGPRGPSMPVMPRDRESAFQIQQQQTQLQRNRSYSTPDINGQAASRSLQQQQQQLLMQQQQFPPNGVHQGGGGVPAVPGIPAHLTHSRNDSTIPRSLSNSPANEMQMPIRPSTQSPAQGQRGKTPQFSPQPMYGHRKGTPSQSGLSGTRMSNGTASMGPPPLTLVDNHNIASPLGAAPLPTSASTSSSMSALTQDMPAATQIKVKVNYDGNYLTLVASLSIPYEQLAGRIDRKLERSTECSIAGGHFALKYRDEEGDLMTIESDEDIREAITEWRDGPGCLYVAGTHGVGEMELYLVRTPGN